MPEPTFRGDPYRVLDVPRGTSSDELKRRWREMAWEHHPDRAVGDPQEQQRLTARMARINAAYDLLRDPVRRARYDASPGAQRTGRDERAASGAESAEGEVGQRGRRSPNGPPPPPPSRPVTARFDTTTAFQFRDTVTGSGARPLRGQDPRPRNIDGAPDLRASTPTGPVSRRSTFQPRMPTLEQARACLLEFGRFHGATLGEVADREPTYVDWIARTITQHRDLVLSARVIAADLDARGIEREIRPSKPGFGTAGPEREAAESSAW
ncbi:MAG: J domain-containing protein [Chloroflexi bacterium]|nr:J domain-containing protein [Chloroflexota bacterium]